MQQNSIVNALRNQDNEEVLNRIKEDVIKLMARHPYLED